MSSNQPAIISHPSPNHGARRDSAVPDLIVLHYTEMARCADALARLCDPATEVSAHYLISETGQIWQLVSEDRRAWHAGVGSWGTATDVNSRSIGIELSNTGKMPFSDPQMSALEGLMAGIISRWTIPPERVIAHSDMTPTRKFDPGPKFDWKRLAMGGLSVWPQSSAPVAGSFFEHTKLFGYPTDVPEDAILSAFRLRFRPGCTGPLDDVDAAMIADLAHRFPVDR